MLEHDDRRTHLRQTMSLFVSATPNGKAMGVTRDVSLGGIFVRSPLPLAVGTHWPIWFVWGSESVKLDTRVVRRDEEGVAMRINSLSLRARCILNELLSLPAAV